MLPDARGMMTVARAVACLAIIWLASSMPAYALNCTVSIADMAFGLVPTLNGAKSDTSTSLLARCEATLEEYTESPEVTLCLSLNSGNVQHYSAPPSGTRKLTNGAQFMMFDIYTDAGRSHVWGSNFDGAFGSLPPAIRLSLSPLSGVAGGGGTTRSNIYGRVLGHQEGLGIGRYAASFVSGQAQVLYDLSSRLPDCSSVGAARFSTETGFHVHADVEGQCSVGVSPLNFGIARGPVIETASSSQVTVRCANQTPYHIALGSGQGPGATNAQRLLVARNLPGSPVVRYGLFQDAAFSSVWGDQPEINTLMGLGNGEIQVYTVHGRVPRQAAPLPGVYTDTVVVSVNF